jgi:hypothetical protein
MPPFWSPSVSVTGPGDFLHPAKASAAPALCRADRRDKEARKRLNFNSYNSTIFIARDALRYKPSQRRTFQKTRTSYVPSLDKFKYPYFRASSALSKTPLFAFVKPTRSGAGDAKTPETYRYFRILNRSFRKRTAPKPKASRLETPKFQSIKKVDNSSVSR